MTENGLPPQIDVSDKNISSVTYNKFDFEETDRTSVKSILFQKADIKLVKKASVEAILIRKKDTGQNLVMYM